MTELPTIPVTLRVHLAHATLQAIAEECGADVLHIKGPAVDLSLRPEGRASVDADVLVRPAHLKRFLEGLRRFGWQQVTTLRSGGVVEHSTNWYHPELGQVDVHVRFPGIQIEPERAFERLWEGRGTQSIASRSCTVPGFEVQRLILLLHAARGERDADVEEAWTNHAEADWDQVSALAVELGADVALAAATGHLDDYRDHPEYDLWRLYKDNAIVTSGFRKVSAVACASPKGYKLVYLRVLLHSLDAIVRMPRRLEAQLSRKPTMREVGAGYKLFLRRAKDMTGR